MAENSKIEWCDHTFNPWVGCEPTRSPGCQNCYARDSLRRWGNDPSARRKTSPANWKKPLKWNRDAERSGTRPAVFCGSMCDFLDPMAPNEWREELWDLISKTPNLTWLLLSKRWENAYLTPSFVALENIYVGKSVCHQGDLENILDFTEVPAKRFFSCEPLVGPVMIPGAVLLQLAGIIVGGESGHKARPMKVEWVESLLHQCERYKVDFFFKQWGEWLHCSQADNVDLGIFIPDSCSPIEGIAKIGTKKTGRLLDGKEYNDLPWRKYERQ